MANNVPRVFVIKRPCRQRGVALLLMLLVAIAAGSFAILKSLNFATSNLAQNDARTTAALEEAKAALIGYAVNTPELTASGLGPGRLPCPDLSGDGAAVGTCSAGGANPTTGWFPHDELELGELRDSSGAKLWYAVAESHRYHLASAINTDTGDSSDDLSVDGQDNIVAVIIAPGPALAGQNRAASTLITDFLEGANASISDADPNNDTDFSAIQSATHNDRIIMISRQELMGLVEKRVLKDAANSLDSYFSEYGGYPWASPFSDPAAKTDFAGASGTFEGHIPVHIDGELLSFAAPGDASEFSWNITGGVVSAGVVPQEACIRNLECNDNDPDINFDFSGVSFSAKSCQWSNAETFNCNASVTVPVTGGKTLVRNYIVNIEGVNPIVNPPTSTEARTRAFPSITTIPTPNGSGTIMVEDFIDGALRGRRSLSLASGDAININIQGIPFKLGDDASEIADRNSSPSALPRWFTENLWHRYVYYGFSASDDLEDTDSCEMAATCLTLEIGENGNVIDTLTNVSGVALIAGRALAGLPRDSSMAGYFELENDQSITPGSTFSKWPASSNFSDQILVLRSDP